MYQVNSIAHLTLLGYGSTQLRDGTHGYEHAYEHASEHFEASSDESRSGMIKRVGVKV